MFVGEVQEELILISGRVRIARSTITGQFAAIKLIKKPADDVKVRSHLIMILIARS